MAHDMSVDEEQIRDDASHTNPSHDEVRQHELEKLRRINEMKEDPIFKELVEKAVSEQFKIEREKEHKSKNIPKGKKVDHDVTKCW